MKDSLQQAAAASPVRGKFMGLMGVIATVIGSQVGSSMFLLPKQLAPYGVWALVGWLVAGLGALALCQVFATLALSSSQTGGPHIYIERAFGPRAAFYAAWSYWVISWLSSLQLFLLASQSLAYIWGPFSSTTHFVVQMATLVVITMANLRGLDFAGKSEIFFSLVKVIPMIILPFLAISLWNISLLQAPKNLDLLTCVNACTVLSFWGFVGLETGTTLVNAVKNPKKTIPRGLFWGTGLVLFIYALNTLSLFLAFPASVLMQEGEPYGLLLSTCLSAGWRKVFPGLIFMICLGTLNSWILASSQVAFSAAKEGLFPKIFDRVNKNYSPVYGVLITCACLGVGAFVLLFGAAQGQIEVLIVCSVSFLIIIYAACICALGKLLLTKQVQAGKMVWIWMVVAALFCLWILASSPWYAALVSGSIPALGWLLSRLFSWPVR